jgi:TolB-like protein/Tfp pilus assembly protein PilF
MDSASNSAVRFGPFELDFRAGHLRKGKTRLHLRPQPFKLLSLLVSRAGQLVTREEIQHQLWDEDTFVDFEQGLNVCIRQIRTALNDTPAASRFVETIPRRGYRFIAPSPRVARSTQVNSLAVLPFENGSGDPDLEYLCHGIAESLINTLSAVQQLRVIPRQIAFRFGSSTDLAKIARELNVQAIVSGRVISLGESVNAQAELVDLETNSQLWGGQCSRKLSNIFELQEEISREICQHLRLRLSRGEAKRLQKRYTEDAQAYQLYLRGRYCSEKRTLEGIHKAIEYFNQATENDPRYALAYTGLADAYTLLGSGTYGAMPSRNARVRATEMAVKALEMDSTLAEAHTSLAFVRFRFDWAWSEAEREFSRALALNPRYVRAHHWYALFLAAMGRHDEAIKEIGIAKKLDPLALIVSVAEGRILHFARRFDNAIEQFRKILDLDPNFIPAHCDLGASCEEKGMLHQALAEFEICVALSKGGPLYVASVAEAHARLGNKDVALNILTQLEASTEQYVSPSSISLIYSSLGELDLAFLWQEKAYEERDASLAWVKVAPESDALRSDRRFSDLLRRMNFPDSE